MPKLSRRRFLLLALLTLAIMAGVSVWLAASGKSEFEQKCDRIKPGTTIQEALAILKADQSELTFVFQERSTIYARTKTEQVHLAFHNDRLVEREFIPMPRIELMRRNWRRTFRFEPPF